ncbi:Aste57867_21509 [Aphanomyces stellatus]|uniref:Aste57867_21509 protein n=1 Tax=Aphanomyces stellatus TaxID=120398 RepID=A0A485LJS9_9STRA|nr:hypothetical protein As57867_021440 [Aphanomyces stellatus]VFT98179.1 Aste57867_21509 [Aphanomyces stellatus]
MMAPRGDLEDETFDAGFLGPLHYAVSCLLQPMPGHFADLDDVAVVDDAYLRRRIPSASSEALLLAALRYIKLTRSLLRVCDDCYVHADTPVDEAVGEMHQIAKDMQVIETSGNQGGDDNEDDDDVGDAADDDVFYSPRGSAASAALFGSTSQDATTPPASRPSPRTPPSAIQRHWLGRIQDLFFGQPELVVATTEAASAALDRWHEQDNAPHTPDDTATLPPVLVNTIDSMGQFPTNLKLQFNGLSRLVQFVQADGGLTWCIVVLTSLSDHAMMVLQRLDAFTAIAAAMNVLAKSKKAQIAALSLLGSPDLPPLATPLVASLHRLVRHAMTTFRSSARVQGLGCLALANLSHASAPSRQRMGRPRQCVTAYAEADGDDTDGISHADMVATAQTSLECIASAMRRFQTDATIQAAGCWVLGTLCAQDGTILTESSTLNDDEADDLVYAVLDAGGLALVDQCKKQFPDDVRIQQKADFALARLLQPTSRPALATSSPSGCRVQ